MFIVVSFPWPVPSANVELTGPRPARERPVRPGTPNDGLLLRELATAGAS
jgi:hypothetical protein